MRVAFFGTPAFAVPTLTALIDHGPRPVVVVSNPDRPRTRSHSTRLASPVTSVARDAGIPVLQPERPRGAEFLDQLRGFDLDLAVVVAYGHLLVDEVLAVPRHGYLNVHASLLPRWRGAAPIHWTLLSGDPTTGVSIMQLEAGLDTGPVWHQVSLPIGSEDTTGVLFDRLSQLGAQALIDTLPLLNSAQMPVPQDHSRASYAPKVDRTLARIDWAAPAEVVSRQIRAMDPAPGAWTSHLERDIKLFGPRLAAGEPTMAPGRFMIAGTELRIGCGTATALSVAEVQPAGRRRMPAADWVRGLDPADRHQFS